MPDVMSDAVAALEAQRNAAQNECVRIHMQLAAARRRIAELEALAAPKADAKTGGKK